MTDTVAAAMEAALAQLLPEVVASFASDPEWTLRDVLGLSVVPVDRLDAVRREGGACDGVSYLDDGVILYRPTGNRRQFFTLAHELGHWLVDQTDEVYDVLARERESAKMLETVCDRIAQALLLPEALVESVLADKPPSASHVGDLMEFSWASRPVCAIALAGRLRGPGAVVITNLDRTQIAYASVSPDRMEGWPTVFPWPGQPVPPGHPLGFVQAGRRITQKSFWETPWGARAHYYLDAVSDGNRAVGVFADTDVWGAELFHLDAQREFDRRPEGEVRCCGMTTVARGWPCTTCGEQLCPRCGKCRCDRRAALEARCTVCGLQYLPHLMTDGVCVDCG